MIMIDKIFGRRQPAHWEEWPKQGQNFRVCLNIEAECKQQVSLKRIPCFPRPPHLKKCPDHCDGIVQVIEGLRLLVRVVWSLLKEVDDLLPEMVAVLVCQPAGGDCPDDGVQVPPAGQSVVLEQAALFEATHGPAQFCGRRYGFRCSLPACVRSFIVLAFFKVGSIVAPSLRSFLL